MLDLDQVTVRFGSTTAVDRLSLHVERVTLGAGGPQALVATCAEVRRASAAALPGCEDGRVYRIDPPARPFYDVRPEPAPDPAGVDAALAQAGLPAAAGALRFELVGKDTVYAPQVLVPPALAPPAAPEDAGFCCVWVAMSGARWDPQAAMAALAKHQPGSTWGSLFTTVDRLDTVRIYSGVIAVGTVAALVIGLVALAVASVDRALERRAGLAHLAALGTPPRTLRLALAAQTLPLAVATLGFAALVAVVGGSAYLRCDDVTASLPLATLAWFLALACGAALITTALALLGTVVRPRADLLRRT